MRDHCCDLICYRYTCLSCESHTKNSRDPKVKKTSHTFNAWDPDVLSQLPEYIRLAFPFLLTTRSGILLSILDGFCDDVVHGMERGDKPMCAISGKHANHLESYLKKYFAKSNVLTTLYNIQLEDERLRNDLRETDSSADHYMVGEPSAPVQPPSRLSPPQTLVLEQPPAATTRHPRMQTPRPFRLIMPSASTSLRPTLPAFFFHLNSLAIKP
jgi:hypothetical protein